MRTPEAPSPRDGGQGEVEILDDSHHMIFSRFYFVIEYVFFLIFFAGFEIITCTAHPTAAISSHSGPLWPFAARTIPKTTLKRVFRGIL